MSKRIGRPPGTPNPNAGRKKSIATLRVGQHYNASGKHYAGDIPPWYDDWVVADVDGSITFKSSDGFVVTLELDTGE
jgi:hypothetical protein